jgi:cysteinyl-tRNA synthetase
LVNGKFSKTGFYSLTNPPIKEFSDELKDSILKKYLELKIISPEVLKNEPNWLDKNFGFDPLAYRLMLFENNYSQQMNFTWEKLWQSQMRLWNLRKEAAKINSAAGKKWEDFEQNIYTEKDQISPEIQTWSQELLNDLNTAKFLEFYQNELTKGANSIDKQGFLPEDILSNKNRYLLWKFEKSFLKLDLFPTGNPRPILVKTGIFKTSKSNFPSQLSTLASERNLHKIDKNYQKADELRARIQKLGWQVDDYSWGYGLWFRG